MAKSNFVGLRHREPVYRDLRELLMSYFEPFFNVAGNRTLRGYTKPLNLHRFDKRRWTTDSATMELIAQGLDAAPRVTLFTPAQLRAFTKVDRWTYEANLSRAERERALHAKARLTMLRFELEHETLRLGVVRLVGLTSAESRPRAARRGSRCRGRRQGRPRALSESVRSAVRNVLRKGGYKPTGGGKPASEFLLGAALGEAGMPRISNLVDILNLASLQHAHPVSLLDAELAGAELVRTLWPSRESYVFNPSGQSMDIAGLPVVCRGAASEPVANAVKDSMLCKVHAGTRTALAIVYGSRELPDAALRAVCERLGELYRDHAGGRVAGETELVP